MLLLPELCTPNTYRRVNGSFFHEGTVALGSDAWDRMNSGMSYSRGERRIRLKWEEVMKAALGMADLFKEFNLEIMSCELSS